MRTILRKALGAALVLVLALAGGITILALLPLADPLGQKPNSEALFIENATIVDVAENRLIHNQSLLVKDGLIARVAPSSQFPQPENTQKIDAHGKFLTPGLWDMHSHLAFQTAPQMNMPLYIAAGVTNIRDMQGVVNINAERKIWREQIKTRQLLGPRLISYADEIVGNNYDEKDVVEVVERSAADPGTFIKIYSGILSERYFALAAEANKKGVVFAGHYPNAIDAVEAANAGQRSFEHGWLFIAQASEHAEAQRERYRNIYSGIDVTPPTIATRREWLEDFDEARFDALTAAMVANGTFFTPTHITRRFEAMAGDPAFRADPRLRFIPPMMNIVWQDDADSEAAWHGEAGHKYTVDVYLRGLELTGRAHEKGVQILAGSDTGDPYSFAGFSIYDELAELVKAGLTPAEALAAATINPARYFNLEGRFGTLDVGKAADIVLLSQNPLEDIENIRTVEAVVYDGSYYGQEDLNSFKDFVEQNTSGLKGISMSLKMFGRLFTDNRN
jgi:imidazolonepropionase-like amidohydrolase